MIGLARPPQMINSWSRFQVSLLTCLVSLAVSKPCLGRTIVGWCNVKPPLKDGGVTLLA
jgi:hypothetical protein